MITILVCNIGYAQENNQTPEEITLERITEMQQNGDNELDLIGLNLTEVPSVIFELTYLTKLDLSYNMLTSIPSEIDMLGQLEMLGLSGNQLTEIPPEIGNLGQLRELYITNNQITTLPSEIGMLGQLKVLELISNQLTEIPPEIGNLSQLEVLRLSGNPLTDIPPEIGNLSQLRELHITNSQITTLPLELSNLEQLSYLNLRNNQLNEIPELNMRPDAYISTRGNPLLSIPFYVRATGDFGVADYLKNPVVWYVKWVAIAVAGLLAIYVMFRASRWLARPFSRSVAINSIRGLAIAWTMALLVFTGTLIIFSNGMRSGGSIPLDWFVIPVVALIVGIIGYIVSVNLAKYLWDSVNVLRRLLFLSIAVAIPTVAIQAGCVFGFVYLANSL
ncbi:MAG: leucine-rich repeat domain-containing protein [Bacteroidota bacterium]